MTNNLQELTSANNHATLEVSFLQLLMMIMMTTMMIVTILIRLVTQGPPFREAVYLAEGYPLAHPCTIAGCTTYSRVTFAAYI